MREGVKYKYIKTFEPQPWQVAPWRDTSPIMLLAGSAGGGKSRLAAEKCHAFALKYPESTVLMLRKSRAVMSNSTLLFIRSQVIGNDPRVKHRPSDFRFEYKNGSVLVYGGMKDSEQRERIRSIGLKGGIDLAWLEEANQFEEEDFNEVLARMRGAAAPWTQIILSTNPDAPGHWINVRLILGHEASTYYSSAADNEYNPASYINTLESLTGVQYRRLVLGEWTAGSGKIIDTWEDTFNDVKQIDFGGNVRLDADYIPGGGDVVWTVDDGYSGVMDRNTRMFTGKSHPRAFLLVQLRQDGTIAIFAEHVAIKKLALDHIREVKRMCSENNWPLPIYVVRDRAAASLDEAFRQAGLRSLYGHMTVEESIKVLREDCAADENGVRRMIAHPRLFYLRYQMQTYSYDDEGRVVKQHDDTCLSGNAIITTNRGDVKIGDVISGDSVLTRAGYRDVLATGMTSPSEPTWIAEFSDGTKIEGTANHPVCVDNDRFVPLASLRVGDTISHVSQYINKENESCRLKQLFLTVSSLGDTPNRAVRATKDIFLRADSTLRMVSSNYIGKFIKSITDKSRMDTMFITSTGIISTTPQIIWSQYRGWNISNFTRAGKSPRRCSTILRISDHLQKNGTGVTKAEDGIGDTQRKSGKPKSRQKASANNAGRFTKRFFHLGQSFARMVVSLPTGGVSGPISSPKIASVVEKVFGLINTTRQKRAEIRVLRTYESGERKPVYNLTIDGEHEFFANGILVHNCDAARYLSWHLRFDGPPIVDVATWRDVEDEIKNMRFSYA